MLHLEKEFLLKGLSNYLEPVCWRYAKKFSSAMLPSKKMAAKLYNSVTKGFDDMAIYLPENFREYYPSMAEEYIDSIDVMFPRRYFAKDPYKLSDWAEKYFKCNNFGNNDNMLRNLIYLDFSYNNLAINEIGIYKRKLTGNEFSEWLLYMDLNSYKKTFYARIDEIKDNLMTEFFLFPFNLLDKSKIDSILQNEMDFFYLIKKD